LVLILIVLVIRSRRKVLPDNDLLRDIIDIKLADHNKTNHQTDCVVDGRSANVPEKRGRRKKRINTTKGFKIAIKELKQRHNEIIKSRQAELLAQQKAVRLAAVNEQLQSETTVSKQAEQHPIQKVSEIAAFNEQFQQEKLEQEQPSNAPEESSEQDLKSKNQSQPFDIAEFSKAAISKRQRQRSGLFNEDRNIAED
jgi:phenylalanyl-tRNA synthetase alpha subunit